MNPKLKRIQSEHNPRKLIENRTVFGGEESEFAIYDTFEKVNSVSFQASNPLFCGMITGRKIIHINQNPTFEFLPGETLVAPSGQEFLIDFPEADLNRPTKCLTVEIDSGKINKIINRLNERFPCSEDSGEWGYEDQFYQHFQNPRHIERLTYQLIQVFVEDHPLRDSLIDAKTTELVIRMLQMRSVARLLKNSKQEASSHGLANAAKFIKENLNRPIPIDEVAQKAAMSRANLFRHFKNEFGMTPLQYTHRLRLELACELLLQPGNSVTDVCYMLGYSSVSYFISLFKNLNRITPKQFQMRKNLSVHDRQPS